MIEKIKRSIQPAINIYHLLKAVAANLIYGFPSRKIKVIGVTGTDGKTTTTHLIHHILKSLNKRASMVSTIYAPGLHTTTPDALEVQKIISKAVAAGDEYLVLETTSHALDQNRVWGVKFEIGVVTNITNEHLDYHKTYDRYLRAKAKLLLRSQKAILNADDGSYKQLRELLAAHKKRINSYGIKNQATFKKDFRKQIDNLTDFNNYNYLAAYSVATLLNLDEDAVVQSLKTFKLPTGRLEVVYDKKFKVIVDFAHTPNSLDKVLADVRKQLVKGGRLIHVFGAAGLRDNKKRSAMGEASAKHADTIILTEEDYRTEDPAKICDQIIRGIKNIGKTPYAVILDRAQAIEKALSIAQNGDIVITTGKGHEQSLCRGKIEYPWDEKTAIMKALKKL